MEKAFNDSKMMNNGFQDPMGYDAHQGLERWLDKFHQPTVPSHTIITDPEYFVFLWFHNAVGNLIKCPYINGGYTTKLQSSSVNFDEVNAKFWGTGIQGGTNDVNLPSKCIDLTPFVREASLPDIAPAGAEQIQTLFGNTTAGAFSPYASDGQKPITLQMVDTEYSILDAIFYPWMKDINSPWWYRPDDVYTKWATPYPMATLEVQRPRMRYRSNPEAQESRNDSDYTYYSYKFIGVKPTSYGSFEVNGAGRQNLLRTLSLTSDMCIVDLTGDVAGSNSESTNLGNRTKFIFEEEPTTSPDDENDNENENPDEDNPNDELSDDQNDLDDVNNDIDNNNDDIDQQNDDDMPGEDEPEWMNPYDDGYNPDEYSDPYGDNDEPNDEDGDDSDNDEPDSDTEKPEEEKSWWEKLKDGVSNLFSNPNSDKNDSDNDKDDDDSDDDDEEKPEEEKSWLDKIKDGLSNVGDKIKDAASDAVGWVKDKVDEAKDKVKDTAQNIADAAVGAAKKIGNSVLGFFGLGNNDDDSKDEDNDDNDSNDDNSEPESSGPASDLQEEAKAEEKKPKNTVLQQMNKRKQQLNDEYQKRQRQARARQSLYGGGYASSPIMREVRSEDSTEVVPFLFLHKALLEQFFSSGLVSFGVVADSSSTLPNTPNGRNVVYGGSYTEMSSKAFPYSGEIMAHSGNVISKCLNKMNGIQTTSYGEVQGMLKQMTDSVEEVNFARSMCDALNQATLYILLNMETVGTVVEKSIGVMDQGEFGLLIRRVTTSRHGRPTPIETFVQMVTGKDATGASMA